MPKIVIITLTLFLVIQIMSIDDKQFGKSQSMYKKIDMTLELLEPKIITKQQQQQDYKTNYIQVNYMPQLKSQFKLTAAKINESIFYTGINQGNMTIEIVVAGQHDKVSHLQIPSKCITVYIIDYYLQQVIQSYSIYQHRIINLTNIQNKLYQILFKLSQQQDKNYSTKTITIQTYIQGTQKQQINIRWLQQYYRKISNLYDQATIIFLDSLEGWDIIDASTIKYRKHQNNWKIYSIFQLVLLLIVSAVQLMYLRKLLQNDVLII